jgi:hypothetical protein
VTNLLKRIWSVDEKFSILGPVLYQLCHALYDSGKYVEGWSSATLGPVSKKDDANLLGRGDADSLSNSLLQLQ